MDVTVHYLWHEKMSIQGILSMGIWYTGAHRRSSLWGFTVVGILNNHYFFVCVTGDAMMINNVGIDSCSTLYREISPGLQGV